MPKIMYKGCGVPRLEVNDCRFWEYDSELTVIALRKAFHLVIDRSFLNVACNDCFRRLPGGRSFEEVWHDPAVWVCYDGRRDRGWYGAFTSVSAGRKTLSLITISQKSFDKGAEWVAGTLVHELAHANGAPGAPSTLADETLIPCDFKAAYEGAVGQRRVRPSSRVG
jgi:hypothetical protein